MIVGRLLDLRDHLLNAWDRVAMMPRRVFIYPALALAFPLPALALSADGTEPSPAGLSVGVSLDRCGLIETEVVCKLDVAYDEIPDATSYTASVTRPDGSVVDYGEVEGGGTSLWVPYVGSGTYSVEIAAYGYPERPGQRPRLLTQDESSAGGRAPGGAPSQPTAATRDGQPGEAPDANTGEQGAGAEHGGAPPAPDCTEAEGPDAEEPLVDSDGDGVPDDLEGEAKPGPESSEATAASRGEEPETAAAALETEAALPESIDCPND